MGAYVSLEVCKETTLAALGGIKKGEFEGDPDIAGIGIFASFLAVTSFALCLSCVIVMLNMLKHRVVPFCCWGQGIGEPAKKHVTKPTFSEILQAMVLSCSDAQIFTGAAYAVTLRFFAGCLISAYHYNIVANMMLLTCATHLMAISVVRNYWESPWLGGLRVICKTGIFLVTGLLLANQNASLEDAFPTEIPKPGTQNSLLFLGAACFQSQSPQLQHTLDESFRDLKGSIVLSSPGNHIEGWNKFLVILLWYSAAIAMEIAMFIRRGKARNGRRARIVKRFWTIAVKLVKGPFEKFSRKSTPIEASPIAPPPRASTQGRKSTDERTIRGIKRVGQYTLAVYSLGSIAICVWTVVESGMYMAKLRLWVQRSGWLALNDQGLNPENDPTSFGQRNEEPQRWQEYA
ncbi:hypothetical protein G7Z17_g13070 [Cylindrodendrum hubeiense]|uniref:Uncharacterized protein n=1 Tax=Cylindrodendrum hubeiense TaxID=595255 RepID=A0A9P5GUA5_9HYPO|nr:hypothetical protein G7Z17_g13070 [Cylindrodendrum hubeiense]